MKINPKVKKLLMKSLELLVYVGVGYFLYNKLGGNLSKIDISDFNYPLLILSIIVFSFHNIFNGTTWDYLIRSLGNTTKKIEQMDVYIRSYIMRYIPGTVVGIMARGIFNRKYKISMGQSLWGWFLENITYLGLAILLGSFAILNGAVSSTVLIVIMVITIITAVVMFVRTELLEKIFNDIVVKKIAGKYKEDMKEIKLDISTNSKVQLFFRYMLAWVIYSTSYLILLKAVGIDPFENIILYISINALSYAIGYLSLITPSGAGVREGVMVASLTDIAMIDPEIAVVVAVAARVVFILGELSGFVMFYLYKVINKENGERV